MFAGCYLLPLAAFYIYLSPLSKHKDIDNFILPNKRLAPIRSYTNLLTKFFHTIKTYNRFHLFVIIEVASEEKLSPLSQEREQFQNFRSMPCNKHSLLNYFVANFPKLMVSIYVEKSNSPQKAVGGSCLNL